MNFRFVQPTGLLREFIKYYCFMESDLHERNTSERVIPTENIQLMFHYKTPFVVHHSDNTLRQQPHSVLSGLNQSYSDVSTYGETGVVFILFHPAGASHFFNFPLHEIENQSIDLNDVLGNEVKMVEELLQAATTPLEQVIVIENFLLRRFAPISAPDYLLLQCGLQVIKQNRGQITSHGLADKLSTTTKSLERKFSGYLGKTPKQFIKLIRFKQTLIDFSRRKDINLTEYAYRNGYFDQSHFIRDFKLFTGYTPKEFIARYPQFDIETELCTG